MITPRTWACFSTFCLSLTYIPALPFWSGAAVALVPGCLKFREFFFLFGVTPANLSFSQTSLPQLQCPLRKRALLLPFQRIPRHLQFPMYQKESPGFSQKPVLLLCPLAFLWSFFSKVLLFYCASYAHSQTQRNEATLQCPLRVPKVHGSIHLINTDLEGRHFA